MKPYKTLKGKSNLILKGIAMGAANKVPGVSGGIVAVVLGFYEEFIESLQKFDRIGLSLLVSGRLISFFKHINGRFLSLLFTGMIVSFFSVSKILDFLIVNYELYVWSLFFGMIIGSVIYIFNDFEKWKWESILWTVIGIIVGGSLNFLSPLSQNDNLWFVFFCGIVSIIGMTLPGFSGSFILMLLGNYVLLLVDAVNALFDTLVNVISGNFQFVSDPYISKMLKILMVFTLGSVVGLIVLSHILNFVLKHYKNTTMALIMGFVTGSLGVVWPWKTAIYKSNAMDQYILDSNGENRIVNYQRYMPEFSVDTLFALLLIIFGIALVLGLQWRAKHKKING